eukprot:COSAG01_NODE_16625_length_1220_cov_0.985727_2_plen_92_part_00
MIGRGQQQHCIEYVASPRHPPRRPPRHPPPDAETARHAPTKVADILLLRFSDLNFIPDIIWASPPSACDTLVCHTPLCIHGIVCDTSYRIS